MLSDWESSLTELSSEEDEYIPTTKKRKAPRRQPKNEYEYKVTTSLKPYRTTTCTAKSLYDQIIDNTIQLDPEYQRDIVWSEAKQSGLIDSVLRNFYIPPVIFAMTTHDDGTQTRVCIDGKQRLTSIQLFMDGLIAHKDVKTNKKYWYKGATGQYRQILPKSLIQSFANKQITCIEYDDLTDDQERDIFQRVQLGVALTAAERMQAISGPWPSLIREIQSIVLGDEGFGEDLDWGHDRGRDFQCLATILCLIDSHPNTSFPGSMKLEKWLMTTKPASPKLRADVLETFKIFIALVKDKKYNTAFQKPSRVSPIEFTMTGVLIYLFKHTYSLKQLSSAIWQMRADVRKHFIDIRANTKVTKVMFEFLQKGLKSVELVSDGKGDKPATVAIKEMNSVVGLEDGGTEPKEKEKRGRKRQVLESGDDSEYEPSPTFSRRASMPQPPASRASAAKALTSKSTTRKVSARANPKASTSNTVDNSPAMLVEASQTVESPPVPRSTPSQTTSQLEQAPEAMKLTSRKTRTAMAAAADSLFQLSASSTEAAAAGPPANNSSKISLKIPRTERTSPGVKMEVDPPSLNNGPDDNVMLVDEAPYGAKAVTGSASGNNGLRCHPTTTNGSASLVTVAQANVASSQSLEQLDQVQTQRSIALNTVQPSSMASPSLPIPPPPPSIIAQPVSGVLSIPSESLPQRPSTSANAALQDWPRRPVAVLPPVAPRSYRDRERRRLSDGNWGPRDRDHDLDREHYDYRAPGRSRETDRDRWDTRNARDWKPPEQNWQRMDRSWERDWDSQRERGRYPQHSSSRERGRGQ